MVDSPIKHKGNEDLFLALELSLVATLAGIPLHVHAEGLRGTGKTTVMRWAKECLPTISQTPGCGYHCVPGAAGCPQHLGQEDETRRLLPEQVTMPYLEIGHGAKLGTILGSIDLARLTSVDMPQASLMLGSIPMANRGILFVDEVNRLAETAPEISDVLLGVMGTKPGLVKIEEIGLPPCEIDVFCSVWAASNPDENPGPLEYVRRQLADRFDLVVSVTRPSDLATVESLLGFEPKGQSRNRAQAFANLEQKAERFACVTTSRDAARYIAELYIKHNVESLRAVQALSLAARLNAAISGGTEASLDDVHAVLPLALKHRVEPAAFLRILEDSRKQDEPPSPRPVPEPTIAGNSSSTTRSHSGFRSDDRPQTQPRTRNIFQNWFKRFGGTKSASLSSSTSEPGPSSIAESNPVLADPTESPTCSPPDSARPLNALSWEQAVTPPQLVERDSGR